MHTPVRKKKVSVGGGLLLKCGPTYGNQFHLTISYHTSCSALGRDTTNPKRANTGDWCTITNNRLNAIGDRVKL